MDKLTEFSSAREFCGLLKKLIGIYMKIDKINGDIVYRLFRKSIDLLK